MRGAQCSEARVLALPQYAWCPRLPSPACRPSSPQRGEGFICCAALSSPSPLWGGRGGGCSASQTQWLENSPHPAAATHPARGREVCDVAPSSPRPFGERVRVRGSPMLRSRVLALPQCAWCPRRPSPACRPPSPQRGEGFRWGTALPLVLSRRRPSAPPHRFRAAPLPQRCTPSPPRPSGERDGVRGCPMRRSRVRARREAKPPCLKATPTPYRTLSAAGRAPCCGASRSRPVATMAAMHYGPPEPI